MEDTPHMGAITFGGTTSPVALFKALAAAQAEMLPAVKDGDNPHFRSRYATLAAVLQAVLPAYNRHGLSITQHPHLAEGVVYLTTVITHESGQWMSSVVGAPLTGRKDAQAVGSAITYLRRYATQSIAGLPVEDDDGNAASGRHRPQAPAPQAESIVPRRVKALSPAELDKALTDLELTPDDMREWCTAHNRPAPAEMTPVQQSQMLKWLSGAGATQVRKWLEMHYRIKEAALSKDGADD
jgi:hypothetical protein